jgi:hypothetical protein
MTKIISSLAAILIGLCLHLATAQAQLVRTCVSQAKGSDANASSSCHCSTPCRTFATAAANTLADGEVTVLDPGDYGGLTITRSISINNDSGGEASITVSGNTTGIIVNAPNGAGYVNLRGLTIQGVGFGTTKGLTFNSGFSLTMTNCVVRDHTGAGIEFFPNAGSNLAMSNTLVADNGVATGAGAIFVFPSGSGTVNVTLSRVEVYNNSGHGIHVNGAVSTGKINATVSESVSSSNSFSGFQVSSTNGNAPTNLMIVRSVSANNGTGIFTNNPTGNNAIVRLSQSTVTGNNSGFQNTGAAAVLSYGDNNIDGNGLGTETPAGLLTKK